MKEIPDEPFEPTEFFKFNAIGDKFGGWFLDVKKGRFGPDYSFRRKDGTRVTLTASGALAAQLGRANLKPGYLVLITFIATQDTGQQYPMKKFKVLVDDAPAQKMPAAAVAATPVAHKDPAEDF
jgi:hypothetical protein